MDDDRFMCRCIELASKGRGRVKSNPLVGAVLVRDGAIIAEAWHKAFGEAHAERALLEELNSRSGRSRSSATDICPDDILYINLEPCCHKGKTPPCTDIIIEKGIKNVVIGMEDPNPIVAGKGIDDLRKAGVTVRGPVLRAECEWLNRGFINLIRKGRPWITLKKAQTIDGRIANDDGSFLKITSEQQDRWSHQYLRSTHDAILVGIRTVITDDPQLSIRHVESDHQPVPIILDPDGHMPKDAKLNREGAIIITKEDVPVINGHFDWAALWEQLEGIASILVEGGPETWKSFKEAGMVDAEVTLTSN